MDFYVGQIVRAKAGRDKGGFFIVTQLDGSYAYIANGKKRKVESPKKKKLIHLVPTSAVIQDVGRTNREFRRILSDYCDKSLSL
ncbi:MAG: KOW domain-containing RNA-binding protein [Lachnospiraceae bacterium]|nr:KOW domain-containing RNA-binding protein [Lachnospiraceae bacterium]